MRTRGAVISGAGRGKFDIVDLDVDEPRPDEVLVQVKAAGLCHSDDHLRSGDIAPDIYPFCGGHEGAGTVQQVGASVAHLRPGDHVVFGFLPVCGRCRWCATGRQNLCDSGALALSGGRPHDENPYRLRTLDGRPVGQMASVGTFCEHVLANQQSVIKVSDNLPFDVASLIGCGVGTGWGSAVNRADVRPGDVVIVMGIGGVGIHAVQGARHAGAVEVVAVDPVEFKRDTALGYGATVAFADMAAATTYVRMHTNGQGADSAILTVGIMRSQYVGEAFDAIRKDGTVVVTGLGQLDEVGLPISLFDLTMLQKRIQGSVYGGCNPTWDIPHQVELYERGALRLDGLITARYGLEDINRGYDDMHRGVNLRGVVCF
jgi:S-(hydroxymethyl)glutathione dehydrogenase/alcohol dehydrogenase